MVLEEIRCRIVADIAAALPRRCLATLAVWMEQRFSISLAAMILLETAVSLKLRAKSKPAQSFILLSYHYFGVLGFDI